MTWVILRFIESDTIEAVPSNRFDESTHTCLFPPEHCGKKNIQQFLKNRQKPSATWEKFNVEMLKKKYESYLTATSRAYKACHVDQLSEAETEQIV